MPLFLGACYDRTRKRLLCSVLTKPSPFWKNRALKKRSHPPLCKLNALLNGTTTTVSQRPEKGEGRVRPSRHAEARCLLTQIGGVFFWAPQKRQPTLPKSLARFLGACDVLSTLRVRSRITHARREVFQSRSRTPARRRALLLLITFIVLLTVLTGNCCRFTATTPYECGAIFTILFGVTTYSSTAVLHFERISYRTCSALHPVSSPVDARRRFTVEVSQL